MKRSFEEFKARFPGLYEHADLFDFSVPEGWQDLVWQLSEQLEPLGARAAQVKSKFACLCFYLHGEETDEMSALIRDAETESLRRCELCGKPGEACRKGSWLMIRCAEHAPTEAA